MKTPVCRNCGRSVLHGNLFCSKACGQAPKAAHAQLNAAGFERDTEAPNIYRKNGIAVTVEACNHVGIQKTIEHHTHAASIHAASGLVGKGVHRPVEGAA